ncbi:MAG: iron ABC transporter permease [Pseudonocardiaceae bacterium]
MRPAQDSRMRQLRPVRRLRVATVVVTALSAAVLLSAVHLTQGTAAVAAADLWNVVTGRGTDEAAAVVIDSRLPRLLAGILVGVALGAAGAALQSVTRNALAAPDTLGVNAGAYLAVVTAAAFGLALPVLPAGGLAFVGGLAAAGLVLALSGGGDSGPIRLVLAGSATALALEALTTLLLLLFAQETVGLYAWGQGSLAQIGLGPVFQTGPVVALGLAGLLLLGRRLDIMSLGDDTAAVLGVPVQRTRLFAVLLAVLLCAAAVTVTGPIGFVGLCAPALVRLVSPLVPGLHRHRVLVPVAGIAGVVVVLGADVVLRMVLGAQGGVEIPTGVVTSLVGGAFLVVLAHRFRDSGPTRNAPSAQSARLRDRRTFLVVTVIALAATFGVMVGSLLLGDAKLLLGDVLNWAGGRAGPITSYVLDARVPRVLAALLAGAALALAGAVIQAVCRNPLAEPGILGVSFGAGIGGVLVITVLPLAGAWQLTGAASAGALAASLIVFGLSLRNGLSSDRLVLIGVGVSYGAAAVISFVIVSTDPFNMTKALTWLSGSTYGRTLSHVAPVAIALAVAIPLLLRSRRELDLLALDDDTPRVLGISLDQTRLLLLGVSTLLTATAVAAVGVIGFVGLVAPHAARALAGSLHSRVLPLSILLGALLVAVADTVGRTVIAPAQLPAGLLTALIGTPYFVWLLWRSRTGALRR